MKKGELHHAAFDNFVLGVTPDYEIRIREDVLEEIDGPMLQHGLKEMHGVKLSLPGRKELRPDRQLLDVRFSRFQNHR